MTSPPVIIGTRFYICFYMYMFVLADVLCVYIYVYMRVSVVLLEHRQLLAGVLVCVFGA